MSEMTKRIVRQIRRHAEEEQPRETDKASGLFVPTGSTLLNLALSDRPDGGWGVGKVANVIGDHSSGKTFLSLSAFAEASRMPEFDGYHFIYDDAEQANEFDTSRLFGPDCAKRIHAPMTDKGEPVHSHTIQDFQYHVTHFLKRGEPFIYVLDSFDALTSEEELLRADKVFKARASGKELAGTYGMEKAKHSSEILRIITAGIKKTASLLIIISQTRDNIDPMSFQKRTRSGGKALGFYASYELWMAVDRKLKAKVGEKERVVGVSSKVKVTKNKFSGKVREVKFPILYAYGLDDLASMADFMTEDGGWTKDGSGKVDATDINYPPMHRSKLLAKLDADPAGKADLSRVCAEAWDRLEKLLVGDRKPRYE